MPAIEFMFSAKINMSDLNQLLGLNTKKVNKYENKKNNGIHYTTTPI